MVGSQADLLAGMRVLTPTGYLARVRRALTVALLSGVLTLTATNPARAQSVPLPRVMRAALGPLPRARLVMPLRWPRSPLGGPTAVLADEVAARLMRLPTLGTDAGLGATVCVIDTGADLTHASLRTADGHTRVRALLDLDAPPRGSSSAEVSALEAEFGAAVWDAAAIDDALARGEDAALPADAYGHGTAVAALAVGTDLGVAQGAELLVVRALRADVPGFRDEDLALGARFCARASRDPTRTVVLLALGGHDGAHDGSEPVERVFAAFPGLVVASAGNDGATSVHASVLLDGGEARLEVRVPSPGRAVTGEQHVALALTVTSDAAALEVALEAPDGTRTAWTAPSGTVTADSRGARLALEGDAPRADGSYAMHAVLAGGGELPMALEGGTYALRVRGRGQVDVWLAGYQLTGALFPPSLAGRYASRSGSVTIPGTAPELVTVGALASRLTLGAVSHAAEVAGLAASFTSLGPTRSGAPKPDLAAPGTLIVTALSRDVRAGERNLVGGSAAALASRRVGVDRIALDGSSYAAALVAGVLAVALAEAPSRGEADRALLAAAASRTSPEAWNASAGAGVIDGARFLALRRALLAAAPLDATLDAAKSRASLTRALTTAGADDVFLLARLVTLDGTPLPSGGVVLTRDGADVLTLPVLDGLARGPLPAAALAPGTLRFGVRTDDGTPLGDLVLRVETESAAAPYAAARGGGCATVPGRATTPMGQVFAAIALLASFRGARRRRPTRALATSPDARVSRAS